MAVLGNYYANLLSKDNLMFSEEYIEAFKKVIGHEGGYVFDPDDAGGETIYGISKRAYPHLDIKELTLDDARKIYFEDYWKK